MKLVIIILCLALIGSSFTEKALIKSTKAEQGPRSAEAMSQSVNYGYATNEYVLQNAAAFKNPQIMQKLPIYLNRKFNTVIETPQTVYLANILVHH